MVPSHDQDLGSPPGHFWFFDIIDKNFVKPNHPPNMSTTHLLIGAVPIHRGVVLDINFERKESFPARHAVTNFGPYWKRINYIRGIENARAKAVPGYGDNGGSSGGDDANSQGGSKASSPGGSSAAGPSSSSVARPRASRVESAAGSTAGQSSTQHGRPAPPIADKQEPPDSSHNAAITTTPVFCICEGCSVDSIQGPFHSNYQALHYDDRKTLRGKGGCQIVQDDYQAVLLHRCPPCRSHQSREYKCQDLCGDRENSYRDGQISRSNSSLAFDCEDGAQKVSHEGQDHLKPLDRVKRWQDHSDSGALCLTLPCPGGGSLSSSGGVGVDYGTYSETSGTEYSLKSKSNYPSV